MSELNDEWLKALLFTEPTALKHILVGKSDKPEERRVVLTADTQELQQFVTKHLNTEGAWRQNFELTRDPVGKSRFARVPLNPLRDDVRQHRATTATELNGGYDLLLAGLLLAGAEFGILP
jgi:hypothetical protein